MGPLAVLAAVAVLLAVPSGATAQTGNPFGPIAPPGPQPPPKEPAPRQPRTPLVKDDELSGPELLALVGVAVLLFGGVALAIAREGRRLDGRTRRHHRARRPGVRKRDPRASRSGTPGGERSDAKAPPPPPRKRRPKAKRR